MPPTSERAGIASEWFSWGCQRGTFLKLEVGVRKPATPSSEAGQATAGSSLPVWDSHWDPVSLLGRLRSSGLLSGIYLGDSSDCAPFHLGIQFHSPFHGVGGRVEGRDRQKGPAFGAGGLVGR